MRAADGGRGPHPRRASRLRRGATIALAVVTAALAGLTLFTPSVFSTALRGAGLWPRGDRYTALYFTQPSTLLRPAAGGQLTVAFAIDSHQDGRWRYTHMVSVGPCALFAP